MKKYLQWIVPAFLALGSLGVVGASIAAPSLAPAALEPAPQHVRAAAMTAELLTRFHYKPVPLDDVMSQKIFDRFLKSLDSEKLYFLQSDIDQFAGVRDKLDDAIVRRDLTAPFDIFNLYEKRLSERLLYARGLLSKGFDFSEHENYTYQRIKETWPASETAIQDLWRKRVKNDWLRLKLAGKDDKATRETLEKRYAYALTRLKKLNNEDAFELFMNAYASSIEPHTNYLGPKAKEDFDISMKLSLVGIGAVLQERDEMTVIRELVPGGPAAQSGKLRVGDRIVGVGQAQDIAVTDVTGWRLDDVVRKIRGTENTVVTLHVFSTDAGADSPPQLITLIRKKIPLEQQAAKKSILEVMEGKTLRRVGVISLPTFYQDFEARKQGDKDFRSATRDVASLLAELKKSHVDSVLIDLRNNGGGSLTEAVELSNLFIGSGPVVQQRDAKGRVRVEGSNSATVAWDGQLGVLINRNSASASEIFAAAMQDYGRALIMGEPSYGKGTVQTVVNLDAMARNDNGKLGEVKMTIAQFYRVNGGTTQLRGVVPDITFPTFADSESGESGFDNALAWGQIEAAQFRPIGDLSDLAPLLQMKHEQRIAQNIEFRFLKEDIAEYLKRKADTTLSLNERDRRKEREASELKSKSREKLRLQFKATNKTLAGKDGEDVRQDDGLQSSERSLKEELAAEKLRKLAPDFVLTEAAQILSDSQSLIQSSTRLAQQALLSAARLKRESVEHQ